MKQSLNYASPSVPARAESLGRRDLSRAGKVCMYGGISAIVLLLPATLLVTTTSIEVSKYQSRNSLAGDVMSIIYCALCLVACACGIAAIRSFGRSRKDIVVAIVFGLLSAACFLIFFFVTVVFWPIAIG